MATKTVSKSTCKIPRPQYTPAQFNKLSKSKQRVAVAKDVLVQLKNKAFDTAHCYIQMDFPPDTHIGYEWGDGGFGLRDSDCDNDYRKMDAAIKFGKKYKSDRNRIAAIMKNVITNKGKFKP